MVNPVVNNCNETAGRWQGKGGVVQANRNPSGRVVGRYTNAQACVAVGWGRVKGN